MASTTKSKVKVGTAVHYTPHYGFGEGCHAATVTEVLKNAVATDGVLMVDNERLETVKLAVIVPGNGQMQTQTSEHSEDRHRGTWHDMTTCEV